MSTSGPPDRLLSPPLEKLQHHYRKSNSSTESKSSRFSSCSSSVVPSRKGSPFERPPAPSRLSPDLESRSSNSDCGSDYVSKSGESTYLTAPQSQGDFEKPPYIARSPRSASLDMSSAQITHVDRKHGAKKQHSKHKRGLPHENENGQEPKVGGDKCRFQDIRPRCKGESSASKELDQGVEHPGTITKSIGGLTNTMKGLDDPEDCASHFVPPAPANTTAHRWSSVGIGADELPRRSSVRAHLAGPIPASDAVKKSNSWNHTTNNDEILRVVRARLTFREVPRNNLPIPASITLRRASGISTQRSGESPTNHDGDTSASLLSQLRQLDETQSSASTYLITTDDIDFITDLIKSGFDVKTVATDLPELNTITHRKPSVTNQGVLPPTSIPADIAPTIEDVHQSPKAPHISFKDSKYLDSKPTSGSMRKLSQALLRKSVPEVIWEDTGSPGSQCTSSIVSSSSGGQEKLMNNSNAAWPVGQSSSIDPEVGSSPHATSPRDHQRKSSDDGDNSPTSRVFQWVFKEPTGDMGKAQGPLPQQGEPDENPEPRVLVTRTSPPSTLLFSPDVVSFPPLPARKYTSDWISPLPDMTSPASGDDKSLYDVGIDAQVGSGSRNLKSSSLRVGDQETPSEATKQPRSSANPDSNSYTRRKSANLLHPQVTPRLGDPFKVGNAVGCSSGARRKSSAPSVRLKFNDETMEHHLHEDQTSWVKPRKDSGWPAPKSPSPEELDSRKGSITLQPSSMSGYGQANQNIVRHADRFELLKRLTPLLPEADNSGIYAALTGTQVTKVNCEPNCRVKHVLGNRPFESRKQSTDWIG